MHAVDCTIHYSPEENFKIPHESQWCFHLIEDDLFDAAYKLVANDVSVVHQCIKPHRFILICCNQPLKPWGTEQHHRTHPKS